MSDWKISLIHKSERFRNIRLHRRQLGLIFIFEFMDAITKLDAIPSARLNFGIEFKHPHIG